MKLSKIEQVNEFLAIVDSCKGEVTLRSVDGDIFNLKSKLSQYIAIAALLGQHGDELELFCSDSSVRENSCISVENPGDTIDLLINKYTNITSTP